MTPEDALAQLQGLADPVYAEYAAWMQRNALVPRAFAGLRALAGNRLRKGGEVQPAE